MPIIFFGTLSVTPNSGAAGDTVIINNTGAGFLGVMIVRFGGPLGVLATNIVITAFGNGQQQMTCTVPENEGIVDIYIENPDGENGIITNAFEYMGGAVGAFPHGYEFGIELGVST